MTILCVDPDCKSRNRLYEMTRQLRPDDTVLMCRNAKEALRLAEKKGCDLLLTRIEIDSFQLDGLMLAELLRERYPQLDVICVTDCKDGMTAYHAWQISAKGYVKKPCTPEDLAKAFANLRWPVQQRQPCEPCRHVRHRTEREYPMEHRSNISLWSQRITAQRLIVLFGI